MATLAYPTRGVCAKQIDIETEDGIIKNVVFHGGCDGNLKAISKLVKGKPLAEVADILEGNTCGPRQTSCADQLACALRSME